MKDVATIEHANSRHMKEQLALSIINQDLRILQASRKKKGKMKCEKELRYKNKLGKILENLIVKRKQLNKIATGK